MLLPVDWFSAPGVRQLGILSIRPDTDTADGWLNGFIAFQRDVNRTLAAVRKGRSASDEFITLCAMVRPEVTYLAHKLAPRALGEIVGTVGLSLIRDAEVFVSPNTDFQTDGFMSVGSMNMPTAD
ncbi:MAG: hypothetical protein PHS41_09500, partial [Victivallaceae bacterium]|nr:hypothetical protein [Victivallaceae bacterium]